MNTIETQTLPSEFTPQTVNDFVGPAKQVAKSIEKSAKMCIPRGAPAAHLFLGPSGSGKTELARFALTAFGINSWNIHEIFGSDLSVEAARDIALSMRLTSLYPGYRAFFFDEFNMATKDARDRALEFCGGRNQPRETVILATANMTVDEFDKLEKTADARGRLTSRFQIHHVEQPGWKDACELLRRWMPESVAQELSLMAATDEKGRVHDAVNMRALMNDATSWLQESN